MPKTNWQDPKSSEIISPHISGLQEAVGKLEESLGISSAAGTGIALSEVYISDSDRYRIYQAPEGKRNWLSSPTPVIKKNGIQITTGFIIEYGGGAIVFTTPLLSTDTITADVTYTVKETTDIRTQINSLDALLGLGGIKESGSNANGSYVKYEDGTMICSASLLLSDVEHTIASGSIFMNSEVIWTYPASFISSASVSGSCTNLAYGKGWLSFMTTHATTEVRYYIMSSMSGTTTAVRVSLIAIGRWKA